MQHEQITDRAVAISIKGVKLTAKLLAKSMQAFLKKARAPASKSKQGEQSLKSLAKQGASISDIEIDGDNIGTFKRTARKYNVYFALKRDDSADTPRWLVFFKAKDDKALQSAFNEYSRRILKYKAVKPSMLEKLGKYRELVRADAAPVRSRNRGEREL